MLEQIHFEKCYLVIPLPNSFYVEYSRFLSEIKKIIPDAKNEDPKWAHITLYYLGIQTDDLLKEIDDIVKPLSNMLLNTKIRISSIQHFEKENPYVLYLDIEDMGGLYDFNKLLCDKLGKYNFQEHPYTPHLTLSRLKDDSSKQLYIQNVEFFRNLTKNVNFEFTIDQLELRGMDPSENLEKKIFYTYR